MYIKVLQCSNEEFWYKNYVGTTFEVKFRDEDTKSYVIDNIDSFGSMGSIFDGDYEIIEEVDENEIFTTPEAQKSERDLELENLRAELEVTQTALNEILMIQIGGNE